MNKQIQAFKKEFVDVDFDKILQGVCDTSTLSSKYYLDYTEYKMNYTMSTSKNYSNIKQTLNKMTDFKSVCKTTGDTLYSYTNYENDNKIYKGIIQEQRVTFNNFIDFIKKIPILESRMKKVI